MTPKWSLGKVPATGSSKQTRASQGLATEALVAAADEDVVDAPVGLAQGAAKGLRRAKVVPGEPSPARAKASWK